MAPHPIQYHAPLFRALAASNDLDLTVLYCHTVGAGERNGAGMGVSFDWDVPLLDGYPHEFLQNVARHPSIGRFGGIDTPEIHRAIRARRFDAVIIMGWYFKSAWQALVACKRYRVPIMAFGDSNLVGRRAGLRSLPSWLGHRALIGMLNACLAPGYHARRYFLHYGANPRRVFTVPYVVSSERFAPGGLPVQSHSERRESLGLDPSRALFVLAARLVDKKRPLDFIRAVARAAVAGTPLQGAIVGDGPLRPACEQLIRDLHAPVRMMGFLNQSELADFFQLCDALVLPSGYGETWGLVVNEAMSCGLPAFVSDLVGCQPDLVFPDRTGAVFPAGNVNRLADLLAEYSGDTARLRRMGLAARKLVSEAEPARAVDGIIAATRAVVR